MNHSIILIPTDGNIDLKSNALSLNRALEENSIPTHLLQESDPDKIENLLASNSQNELLILFVKQLEKSTINNQLTIIQGISLAKPYATELNFAIATALGSAVIFVVSTKEKLLQQTKIIINPYKNRYKKTVLGFIADKKISSLEKDLKLNFIGSSSSGYDISKIQDFLNKPFVYPLTAPIFKHRLIEKTRSVNKKIILPEGDEPRTIEAANICAALGIADCILLEEKDKILETCKQHSLKLHKNIKIVSPKAVREKYVASLFEARKAKGMTIEKARQQLEDNVMLGTMMLHLGEVDGLVSGAVHTSASTIKPAFQIIKTAPGVKLISSVFFMCLPDQVLVYGDCAINPNPTAEELADIAIQSASTAASFGVTPKIAMLSYSTGSSGKGPEVDKVKEATTIVRSLRPDLEVEGPIQYDAAVSEKTAKIKLPESKVAGHATVFIMPNLDVGNIAYKAVQRSTGIVCIGPMMQGMRKPVNDLSRGCTPNDIMFTIAVTVVQSIESS